MKKSPLKFSSTPSGKYAKCLKCGCMFFSSSGVSYRCMECRCAPKGRLTLKSLSKKRKMATSTTVSSKIKPQQPLDGLLSCLPRTEPGRVPSPQESAIFPDRSNGLLEKSSCPAGADSTALCQISSRLNFITEESKEVVASACSTIMHPESNPVMVFKKEAPLLNENVSQDNMGNQARQVKDTQPSKQFSDEEDRGCLSSGSPSSTQDKPTLPPANQYQVIFSPTSIRTASTTDKSEHDETKIRKKNSDPGDDRCLFCGRSTTGMTMLEKELHANSCLDSQENGGTALADEEACFVCGLGLGFMELGERSGHVNRCLDAHGVADGGGAAAVPHAMIDEEPSPPPAAAAVAPGVGPPPPPPPPRGRGGGGGGGDGAAAFAAAAAAAAGEGEEERCGVCGAALGGRPAAARVRHVKACARRHGPAAAAAAAAAAGGVASKEEEEEGAAAAGAGAGAAAGAGGGAVGRVGGGRQAALTAFFPRPPRDAHAVLMRAGRTFGGAFHARPAAEAVAPPARNRGGGGGGGGGGGRGRGRRGGGTFGKKGSTPAELVRRCPAFKKVVGTRPTVVVDGFQYACRRLSEHYFLTHFHADHYGGLDAGFDAGTVYCTPATARLVRLRLRVPAARLRPLELGRPLTLGNVVCTLLDANHCPGAAMVHMVFTDTGETVLHVGDFRWDKAKMVNIKNSSLVGLEPSSLSVRSSETYHSGGLQQKPIVDVIYLDTTYCDPRYTFPTQAKVIEAAVQVAVRHLAEDSTNTLFLVGAYSLGKERLYIELAKQMGLKASMDRSRWQVLACLGWPAEQMALCLPDPQATQLRVVPISHINFKKLGTYLERRGALSSDYSRIIAFQPTGWAFSGTTSSSLLSVRKSGKCIIYGVPYSEHSSFSELKECIAVLKPSRIIPTVNCSSEQKVQEQIRLLSTHGL